MTNRRARWANGVAAVAALGLCLMMVGCPAKPPAAQDALGQPDASEPAIAENSAAPVDDAEPAPPESAPEGEAAASPLTGSAANEAPVNHAPDQAAKQPVAKDSQAEPPAAAAFGLGAKDKPKQYDPLFVGWPQPQAVLVLTGRQDGYVEPCGCTGLDNQKGGLARRHTFLKSLEKRGWPIAPLDVGSQVRRYGAQAELKFQMSVDALKKLKYRAVAFGDEDLRLSVDALIAASVEESPFISANASILGLSGTVRVFELGGRKIGVTAVLGARDQKRVNNEEVELKAADAALAEAIAELKSQKCDYLVLLAHTTLDEARAFVPKHPELDLIVTSGGAELPAYRPEEFEDSKTRLIQVGAKGMYAGVLALYDDEKQPVRFERVSLEARFADSPDMRLLMKSYQQQLETLGLAKLGVRPLPHPSGRKFVGSGTCGECHTRAYEKWASTPHAHATISIKDPKERSDIARHHDPECISCHVTGWNPKEYTPFASGYLDFAKSKLLHGNGCENCHGPGSDHVAAESGEEEVSDEEQANRRRGMRLAKDDAEKKCLECHDLDNSPDFHVPGAFAKYWEQVVHPWRD